MDVFAEISILLVLATAVAILMRLMKQPLIISYIVTGLLIGPAILNIIPSKEMLDIFSSFGTVLLLFIIGLGLNPKIIKDFGRVSIITGLGQIVITAVAGFFLSQLLGFDTVSSIYISVALTFSSTIVVLKLLSDNNEQTKLFGKISIGILLIQDIIATFALITASMASENGLSVELILTMSGKLIALSLLVYLIASTVVRKMTKFLSKSNEMLFLFAISWGFGIATITSLCGFSIEAGALFAGVALAGMPYAQEVASRLKPLRDFFIVIFFVALGSNLNITEVGPIIIPALILSAFVLIGKTIIVNVLMDILGYTKKTGFKTGIALSQISEFSLVFILLGQRGGQIPDEVVYLVTMIGLISITFSTYLISYSNKIYSVLSKIIPLMRNRNGHREKESRPSYSAILFGYKKGGHDFLQLFKEMKKRYVVVDYDPETIEMLEHHNVPHFYGDAHDPELLDEIGIESAKIIISTITEFDTSQFLVRHINKCNPNAIVIVYADTLEQLEQLYEEGASYVILPHYIGSEQMSSYIRKTGFDKEKFDKMHERHVTKIKSQLLD